MSTLNISLSLAEITAMLTVHERRVILPLSVYRRLLPHYGFCHGGWEYKDYPREKGFSRCVRWDSTTHKRFPGEKISFVLGAYLLEDALPQPQDADYLLRKHGWHLTKGDLPICRISTSIGDSAALDEANSILENVEFKDGYMVLPDLPKDIVWHPFGMTRVPLQ